MKVFIQNNRLAIDVPGQTVFELHPPDEEGKWVFRANDGIAVEFNESDAGVESMTRYFAGQELNMPRLDVASEPLPTVDDIMALRDTANRKIALEEMGTYLMTGTIWAPQSGVEGTFSTYVSGINRMREDADFGKFGSTRSAVNGDRAWSENFGRFFEWHGKRLDQAIQSHPAWISGDWRDFFDSIRVLNTAELDGRKVYLLRLQRGELPPATFYVDADTGDLLKSETIARAWRGSRIPVATRYEDYREVHGIRFPFRVVVSNDSDPSRTIIQYDTIETNVEVNDDIFTLSPPAED